MSSYFTPQPPLAIVDTVTPPQVVYNNNGEKQQRDSSSPSSFIIVIIIIVSAIIVFASIYLLLRLLSRRFHRSFRTSSAVDDVVTAVNRDSHSQDRREPPPGDIFNSLPLFTFGSVNGKLSGGDCAVCLSKFESHDQLRLLPLCCHAFHARCIDTWLASNQTCPLCRSTVHTTDEDVLNKVLSASANENGNDSFRVEIGSISRRRAPSDQGRRSYSIGSFEYIVDAGSEVSVESTHRRGASDCTSVDKDSIGVPMNQPEPPGETLASEVATGRSWLREYVDRFASSISVSSRALSFRSSGRFFTGSSRRSDPVVVEDIEANRIGEEIGELFRWISGV